MDKIAKEEFREAVYEIVRRIPYGRATSYGALARAAGHPNMSRLVGKFMAQSGNLKVRIHAHRVVASGGRLTASRMFGERGELESLLDRENIHTRNGKIVDWKKIFWDPLEEINI